jgi:hypothetical protein
MVGIKDQFSETLNVEPDEEREEEETGKSAEQGLLNQERKQPGKGVNTLAAFLR